MHPLGFLLTLIITLLILIGWNKIRVRGKMLCTFVRGDKSVEDKLCRLQDDFVVDGNLAYDIYPDFVRVKRFPSGWPWILQEIVPAALYDEGDAVPLDWINLGNRLESAMNLKSALDENWIRKLVQETAHEGGGFRINWRKIFPIILIAIGAIGLISLVAMGGLSF